LILAMAVACGSEEIAQLPEVGMCDPCPGGVATVFSEQADAGAVGVSCHCPGNPNKQLWLSGPVPASNSYACGFWQGWWAGWVAEGGCYPVP
jgi:hypothetical protein